LNNQNNREGKQQEIREMLRQLKNTSQCRVVSNERKSEKASKFDMNRIYCQAKSDLENSELT